MLKIPVKLAILVTLVAAPALGETFRLSTGRAIETPDVAALDCDQLTDKLFEIDGTGYRGLSPTPLDVYDTPLLIYEEAVATAHYRKCVMQVLSEKLPSVTFTEGHPNQN